MQLFVCLRGDLLKVKLPLAPQYSKIQIPAQGSLNAEGFFSPHEDKSTWDESAIRHRMFGDNAVRVLFGMMWAELFIATRKTHCC